MSFAGEFRRRLTMLLHRGRFQRELDEEMRLHLELRRQKLIAAGLTPEAARQSAQRRFGNTTRIKEKSHMAWGWDRLETFLQDAGMDCALCCAPQPSLWSRSPRWPSA